MTAEEIAAGLTEAQRDIVSKRYGLSGEKFYPGRHHQSCRALSGLGLLVAAADNIGNPMFRLTPLGLAVRAAIMKGEQHD